MKELAFSVLAAAAALAGCTTCGSKVEAEAPIAPAQIARTRPTKAPFKLGIARYTMCSTPFERAVDIVEAVDCRYMSLIEGSVGYDAGDAEIAAYKAKLAKRGITVDTLGPCYFDRRETVEAAFAFAKRYGMKMISVVPFEKRKEGNFESEEMLDVLEEMVRKYDIKAAIHNHGPETPCLFPTAESVWKRIEKRDGRIGFCLDVGHQARFGGGDPVRFIREHADRIYDIHLKNITVDPVKNLAQPGPRGELDIPGILGALAEIGFDGVCHIEYEKDMGNNLVPLAESVGYYLGVMDTLPAKAKMDPVPAGANALTAEEKAEGFELLFDGKTLPADTFVGVKDGFRAFPSKGWFVKDGCLTMRPVNGIAPDGTWFPLPPEDQKLGGGGDIATKATYGDFVFKFDFRLTRAANSGVKYFLDEKENGGSCEEYQILEDAHPDSAKGRDGNRRIASLYDIFPAKADKVAKGAGKWQSGMIVAKGGKVEHWLNGTKVLEYDRASKAFADGVGASKYATWGKGADGKSQPWGLVPRGRILLQDHSDSTVSFCNLKVKPL